MKFRLLLLFFVLMAVVAGVGWYNYVALSTTASRQPVTARQSAENVSVQTQDGATVVVVAVAMQRASHIDVTPLARVDVQPQISAYATVVDLSPLFDLRNQLAAALADGENARAQLAMTRAQYERDKALFEANRAASEQSLQQAEAAMHASQASLQTAEAAQSALSATMRQQFGDVLSQAARAPHSDLFQRLTSGRAVVLRVTLPVAFSGAAPADITIDAANNRAMSARKLSASPQGDPAIQGNPYFYAAEGTLPTGTRTTADVPTSSRPRSELVIPERAVVWFGGEPWVYVRTSSDHFTRHSLATAHESDRGFIATTGFRAGDQVVTQGAQLLLSEESRPQGIATQCKDPPECDD